MKNIKTYEAFDFEKHIEHSKRMKEDPEYRAAEIEKRDKLMREWWMKLKPFVNENDVPDLPKMDDFYINRLIDLGAIPKDKLVDGQWYYGNYRNSDLGKWVDSEQKFHIIRYKFGNMWDRCNHFQDDDGYALFVPLREVNDDEMIDINKQIETIK